MYETIKSLTSDCKAVYDNIKGAYDQVLNATDKINVQMADIKEHRKEMDASWKLMRGNLTDDMFLESINTTKKVMEGAANQSEAMLSIARGIENFLKTIKTSEEQSVTYNQSRDLYKVLVK
ncbi:uncharacterized protein LOC114575608 [Exaiptasia diaphana]|uniref:Uncharacterized protein n=1 Tax=Exaiptasia diaphana TaxID=2652724 RepID=A0A913YNI4_EXADI|nr:uncharacterized protein LOC114575608 [Exaiptasia diaphana]